MATSLHNLSLYDPTTIPSGKGRRFGIVVADWNDRYTYAMRDGAIRTFLANGVSADDIVVRHVPGSFELVYATALMMQAGNVDAIISIGCVIRGDTPHFDYICQGTTQGLAELNTRATVPVIYGLLTCNTEAQAADRTGGALGNKGDECAVAALRMAAISF
ncbi:MAG: 6,7-dimethyl-8-ribityllumazine synthase [Bacteroidaceae bacterium]|nr:6,7-dimethyl-8-ribityllumazine synthase [Bacteroidaceae bacterium]